MLTFSCLLPACLLIHTLAQLCRLDHSTMKNSTGIFIHRTWWFVLWKQLKYRVKIGIQDRTKMKTICKNIQETFSLGVFCCFIKLNAWMLFIYLPVRSTYWHTPSVPEVTGRTLAPDVTGGRSPPLRPRRGRRSGPRTAPERRATPPGPAAPPRLGRTPGRAPSSRPVSVRALSSFLWQCQALRGYWYRSSSAANRNRA